jgi:cytochrome b561
MSIFNSQKGYGLLAKLFHWITFIVLIVQIPFGFYLVSLEFSDRRIDLENIHILIGITIFYITLFRLLWKFFNPSPKNWKIHFKGQAFVAKANHFLLYLSIFTITVSGILKKLYMGEKLNFIFFNFGFEKDNFLLADAFYEVHIYANYLLITLIIVHILAVIVHHFIFREKILKKIT